jgi:hypothetical protein
MLLPSLFVTTASRSDAEPSATLALDVTTEPAGTIKGLARP